MEKPCRRLFARGCLLHRSEGTGHLAQAYGATLLSLSGQEEGLPDGSDWKHGLQDRTGRAGRIVHKSTSETSGKRTVVQALSVTLR